MWLAAFEMRRKVQTRKIALCPTDKTPFDSRNAFPIVYYVPVISTMQLLKPYLIILIFSEDLKARRSPISSLGTLMGKIPNKRIIKNSNNSALRDEEILLETVRGDRSKSLLP